MKTVFEHHHSTYYIFFLWESAWRKNTEVTLYENIVTIKTPTKLGYFVATYVSCYIWAKGTFTWAALCILKTIIMMVNLY